MAFHQLGVVTDPQFYFYLRYVAFQILGVGINTIITNKATHPNPNLLEGKHPRVVNRDRLTDSSGVVSLTGVM